RSITEARRAAHHSRLDSQIRHRAPGPTSATPRCTEAISSDLMAKCVISDAELYLDNRPRRNVMSLTEELLADLENARPPPPRRHHRRNRLTPRVSTMAMARDSAAASCRVAAQFGGLGRLAARCTRCQAETTASNWPGAGTDRSIRSCWPEAAGQRNSRARRSGPPNTSSLSRPNNLAVKIDDEIHINSPVRDSIPGVQRPLYRRPVEYLQTVQQLGNEPFGAVQVPGTLRPYLRSCHHHGGVGDASTTSRRCSSFAPNLSAVVGASVAAKLLGSAGGPWLHPQAAIWFLQRHHPGPPPRPSVRVRRCPLAAEPDLRSKAVRLIAAKCTLAARVDNFHQAPDGSRGEAAHRAPIDPPSKKRAVDDAYQEDLGFSLGNLGRSSSGRIRAR
uniref:Nop domain-containing protein n=1 Tax=Macrostomum lignano TaxID=282301 RepID=A0A1I8FK56_9PLAT